jgi:hypothetical protein
MSNTMKKMNDDGKAADMIGMDDETLELKSRCVPLLFDCPRRVGGAKCPFGKIRLRDIVSRVKWIKAMSLKELTAILKHHTNCMEKGNG